MRGLRGLVLISIVLIQSSALAGNQTFSSPVEQIGVIELYTSEGCSSCPPADRWFSSLKDNRGLWKKIVPLAFHVDYWDYIGWQDRFAMPEYTLRQRRYAAQQSLRTIYTPGFIYNGKEWRTSFFKRFSTFAEGGNPGVLSVNVQEKFAELTFSPSQPLNGKLYYNVALLGFGLKTEIRAGENSGKTLNHDFVVLNVTKGPMRQHNEEFTAATEIPESHVNAQQYALAVWINQGNDISPIQAAGGYLE